MFSTPWSSVFRLSVLAFCVLNLGCKGEETGQSSEPETKVALADEASLNAFDYATALVTHGVPFANQAMKAKTLELAKNVGEHACRMAQRSDETDNKQAPPALSETLAREVERRGNDPYLGLEIARVVAGCYASKVGKKNNTPLAKAMFLSIASNCASRRGASSDQMSKLMLALYDSQEVSLSSFSVTVAKAKSRPVFLRHLLHGSDACPQLDGQRLESQEAVPRAAENTEETEAGRVYIGILRGRAPGRVRLVVKEREISGAVTIGPKKFTVSGKIGRFNTLNMIGRLGMETIELRGKLKDRARKIRGRYNGKIRRRNQPRASRVIGFWEAKLDDSAIP